MIGGCRRSQDATMVRELEANRRQTEDHCTQHTTAAEPPRHPVRGLGSWVGQPKLPNRKLPVYTRWLASGDVAYERNLVVVSDARFQSRMNIDWTISWCLVFYDCHARRIGERIVLRHLIEQRRVDLWLSESRPAA